MVRVHRTVILFNKRVPADFRQICLQTNATVGKVPRAMYIGEICPAVNLVAVDGR